MILRLRIYSEDKQQIKNIRKKIYSFILQKYLDHGVSDENILLMMMMNGELAIVKEKFDNEGIWLYTYCVVFAYTASDQVEFFSKIKIFIKENCINLQYEISSEDEIYLIKDGRLRGLHKNLPNTLLLKIEHKIECDLAQNIFMPLNNSKDSNLLVTNHLLKPYEDYNLSDFDNLVIMLIRNWILTNH